MTLDPFPVLDVAGWAPEPEPATRGEDDKAWLTDPRTGLAVLFKPVVVNARGLQQGEDWSEKLASEIGQLLGVPCATIDLAERRGIPGLISYDVRPGKDLDLFVGAEVLAAADPGYRPGRQNLPGRPGHSLAAIEGALRGYRSPPDTDLLLRDAFDAFVGYLVLDAVIANQDRHDENWAVLRGAVDHRLDCLSPSYDHASSLGFNLTDERREQEQRRDGLATWAARGRGTRFEHAAGGRPATLIDVVRTAMTLASFGARELWRERLAGLDVDAVASVAARVPRMSDPARTFAVRLVDTNRRRLLDVSLDPPA